MASTPWILKPPGGAKAPASTRLRLFCFPQAGSGAWMYHDWQRMLPVGVELMPVELPGHNSRTRESPLKSMAALVEAMGTALMPLLQETPFAFFGHSMGAWVAFELAQELRRRGAPLPRKLYASANRSPTLTGVANDVDPVAMHLLPRDEFWQRFEARYEANPDLADRHLRDFAERPLRADFQVIETYQPPSLQPLPCPVMALGGRADARCTEEQVSLWRGVAPEGEFELRMFEGGHDYIATQRGELVPFLIADISSLISNPPAIAAAAAAGAAPAAARQAASPGPSTATALRLTEGTTDSTAISTASGNAVAAAEVGDSLPPTPFSTVPAELGPQQPAEAGTGGAGGAAVAAAAGKEEEEEEEDVELPVSTDPSFALPPPPPPPLSYPPTATSGVEDPAGPAATIAVVPEDAKGAPVEASCCAANGGAGAGDTQVGAQAPGVESMKRQQGAGAGGGEAPAPAVSSETTCTAFRRDLRLCFCW